MDISSQNCAYFGVHYSISNFHQGYILCVSIIFIQFSSFSLFLFLILFPLNLNFIFYLAVYCVFRSYPAEGLLPRFLFNFLYFPFPLFNFVLPLILILFFYPAATCTTTIVFCIIYIPDFNTEHSMCKNCTQNMTSSSAHISNLYLYLLTSRSYCLS